VLSEEEKGFNQTVLYGRDVTIEDIISTAKRYPMMAERQVVIVKKHKIYVPSTSWRAMPIIQCPPF
jgi:hypothetical protein